MGGSAVRVALFASGGGVPSQDATMKTVIMMANPVTRRAVTRTLSVVVIVFYCFDGLAATIANNCDTYNSQVPKNVRQKRIYERRKFEIIHESHRVQRFKIPSDALWLSGSPSIPDTPDSHADTTEARRGRQRREKPLAVLPPPRETSG